MSAGILSNNKCVETSEKEWDRVMNVNVKGEQGGKELRDGRRELFKPSRG